MRIMIDARFWGTKTGISAYTENLVKNLEIIDRKNKYIILLEEKYFDQYIPKMVNFKKIKISAPHYSVAEQVRLPGLIKKVKPDLVHFTNFNHPIAYRGNCIFTIQDLILSLYPPNVGSIKKELYKLIINSAVQKAKEIIVPTESTRRDLINTLKVKENKIKIIPDGFTAPVIIKDKKKDYLKNKYGISDKYFFYIGRFAPHKNINGLIDAFYLFKLKYGAKYQLVLAGKKDKDYSSLIKRVKKLKLEKDIIFSGFIDDSDLGIVYQKALILLLPSFYEGFGLPVLEAMSVGTPVLTSNISSLPEIAGDAALFVDPEDKKAMAEGINKILSNNKFTKSLVQKGYEQAKKFSWRKMAKETLKVYNSLK
jgi:glycosyltransferase involved in cell wall biosynthesis